MRFTASAADIACQMALRMLTVTAGHTGLPAFLPEPRQSGSRGRIQPRRGLYRFDPQRLASVPARLCTQHTA